MLRKARKGRATNEVDRIVEQKSLRGKEVEVREVNSGIYAFATRALYAHIAELKTDNAHQEYYLTDMAELLRKAGEKVVAVRAPESSEVLGVNTRLELAQLDAKLRDRKARAADGSGYYHLPAGNLRHRRRCRSRDGHGN